MSKIGVGGLFKRVPPDDEGGLTKDEMFDLMSNHRRRYIIHHCKQEQDPISLSDLAEQVAAWEKDKSIAELESAERKTVYTSLQQTHLPRLERAGIVTYDDGEVELTNQTERLDIYLDIVPENSIPWGVYYLGLSGLSCVVVAALWAGVLPTDVIPTLAYPTAIVVAFTISAAYHTLTNRRYRFENLDHPP
ncbi:hypothetical protein [Haloferax sp. DFSO52]|uniref:DUF7344 domain-containing protein n=1 Tax=Haloferax sp. DFSO52 TaxID=3388505 RepID=UPI003A88BED2